VLMTVGAVKMLDERLTQKSRKQERLQ